MNLEDISAIAYASLRAYDQRCGDYNNKEWDRLGDKDKADFRARVSFLLEHPNSPPSALHDHWLATLLLEGWRFNAESTVIDRENKLHPKLIPFTKLPKQSQIRERLLVEVVGVLSRPL